MQLVLQDQPHGKGNAVREGLRHVTGGIILIQDADLEYSVDDYAGLLEPIMNGRGRLHARVSPRARPAHPRHARQAGDRAGRQRRALGVPRLFNVTYGTHLRDPFTMYKVFRTECIDGVEFVADRFDFDWELVAKLVRLGLPAPRDAGRVQRARLRWRQEGAILP